MVRLLALVLALGGCKEGSDRRYDEGVSVELAQWRKATIGDLRYALRFSIPEQRSEAVEGEASIRFTLEQRQEVADYACEELHGVPYHLSSGFIGPKAPDPDAEYFGLQCAYLAWYAWNHFGYDLDGDGGRLVSSDDLLQSELLEVVQMYGMDPEKF